MSGIKIGAIACLATLVIAIMLAAMADPMLTTFIAILDQPTAWPFVITLDLLVGFLFFSFVIYWIEGDVTKTLYWAVPLFVLGNVVSAIYLIANLDRIRTRLSPAAQAG